MPEFMFVETDPLFQHVFEVFGSLGATQQFVVGSNGTKEVSNPNILNRHSLMEWNRNLDFSKTAAVTLRSFFVRVVNLNIAGFVDPVTTTTIPNLATTNQNANPIGFPFQIVQNRVAGEALVWRYDQMFPHFMIDEKLNHSYANNLLGSSFVRGAVILSLNPATNIWSVYHITSSLTWNVRLPLPQDTPHTFRAYNPQASVRCIGSRVNADAHLFCSGWLGLLLLLNGGVTDLFARVARSIAADNASDEESEEEDLDDDEEEDEEEDHPDYESDQDGQDAYRSESEEDE